MNENAYNNQDGMNIKKGNKKRKQCNYIYSEEFITNIKNPTEEDLKAIFNKKYFEYIKRIKNGF